MNRIARFEKVSFKQFLADVTENGCFSEQDVSESYKELKLPERATAQAAGYDFYLPFEIKLNPGESIKVPTGARCRIEDGWVLQIFPRSSLGFRFRLQLDNTVGIIDADYYGADNEGHIIAKISNNGDQTVALKKGDRFIQGIFLPFGITEDDETTTIRTGGFGSTSS